MTKFELTQINSKLATENSVLRSQISKLNYDLEVAGKTGVEGYRSSSGMPAWQVERRITMELAKARAIASRTCIKVGSAS